MIKRHDESDILLKEDAAARRLSVSLSYLRNCRWRGYGGPDFVRLDGRMIRYKSSAVDKYILESTVTMKNEV